MAWQFKGKTPLWFPLITGFLLADTAIRLGLQSTVSSWASPTRDALHIHPLPFRDGVVYWVSAEASLYLHAWWIAVGLFFLLVILLVMNRDRLERST